jgi:hypothetical protein
MIEDKMARNKFPFILPLISTALGNPRAVGKAWNFPVLIGD